mmetsp:Transcript_34906/g.74462  ORF Transcript_34906/g.74462 Transcript_34906/m.74462 type:complete len:260 (+) Transcript_34906:62-841(+)
MMHLFSFLGLSLIFWGAPSSAFAPVATSPHGAAPLPRVKNHRSPSTRLHPFAPIDEVATLASSTLALATTAADPALLEGALNSVSSSTLGVSAILTAENIKVAFSVATFFPQLPWLFLILLPNAGVTKKLLGGYEIVTLCCLIHFFIVTASIAQPDGTAPMAEFADVFDPAGDPQKAMVGMMQYPNFVSEEWSHVLTWDLFVGRWIWLDGLKRGIFTSHSVLLCNLIGPPGLLLHWLTCTLTGKGLPGNEADLQEENDD